MGSRRFRSRAGRVSGSSLGFVDSALQPETLNQQKPELNTSRSGHVASARSILGLRGECAPPRLDERQGLREHGLNQGLEENQKTTYSYMVTVYSSRQ